MNAHKRTGHILWNNGPGWIRKDLESAEIYKAILGNFNVILKTLTEHFGFLLSPLEWLWWHFFSFGCPKVVPVIIQEFNICVLHQKIKTISKSQNHGFTE